MLDTESCYRALQTRDARFDGRFFTGVTSTGIFCRPVCPARTPHLRNCTFYPSAAAAAEAGFRPCLRCGPEVAPGLPTWSGTSATVGRAMRLIAEGALDESSVAVLAERLGLGERHLRRLFLEHVGATPVAVAQTRRVLFAKKLLTETGLPVTDVAFASGFASLRRFNDAMQATYGRPPRELRKATFEAAAGPLTLKLAYRPPYDWDALVGFLKMRAIPGVEIVTDGSYCRTVRAGKFRGTIEVRPQTAKNCLEVRMALDGVPCVREVVDRTRRMFDLDADTSEIGSFLGSDPLLRQAVKKHPGLRVPGAWSEFEVAVRAILGQQISVAAATTLAGRIVERWGEPLAQSSLRLFPEPAILAEADLRTIGVTGARAESLRSLARAAASGALDSDSTIERLCALDGIGDWTAQYIAMRGFGDPDAFPSSDLGLRRAAGGIPAKELVGRAEAWRPWRAYAAVYLWSIYQEADSQGGKNGTAL
jgi:AraC family transcriptional regulator of adaptative response / DNA-3-methyladenine glycosylase II